MSNAPAMVSSLTLWKKQSFKSNAKGNRGRLTKDGQRKDKRSKGVRRMPRLSEAKKDVISCEKLRGGANIP